MAITDTKTIIDAAYLPGGSQAFVRVIGTDGLNTTLVQSASFAVGKKAPEVAIISPDSTTSIQPDLPTLLEGYAIDPEDGTLPDSSLSWTSSRNGAIGTGATALVTLTQGLHTLTLSAIDSNGNISQPAT